MVRAGEFAAFDIAMSLKLHTLTFPAGEPTHWQYVDVQFRAPGGGSISTKPGMGAWKPVPPVPAGGIRIVRGAGKGTLANGAPWPRDNAGYYWQATVLIHAFVETDGSVATTKILRSSGLPVFDQAAISAVNEKLQAASGQAHWQDIPVEFWPSVDHMPPEALEPASRY